ncbi:hypothetical protein KC19_4G245300 [Ceratodon purpureus]|uniref:Uncharacterized protein n=1 Tax=Ceratodon purpureus TaxID=3225 RepID=A0A8T0IC91_CERPU|nr:hypothetical protein KC19_4G245300 [Ceratodon purpureus]
MAAPCVARPRPGAAFLTRDGNPVSEGATGVTEGEGQSVFRNAACRRAPRGSDFAVGPLVFEAISGATGFAVSSAGSASCGEDSRNFPSTSACSWHVASTPAPSSSSPMASSTTSSTITAARGRIASNTPSAPSNVSGMTSSPLFSTPPNGRASGDC